MHFININIIYTHVQIRARPMNIFCKIAACLVFDVFARSTEILSS